MLKNKSDDSSLRNDIDDFINRWHSGFILDYWWRKKHNVSFGSPEHRCMNFIDMYIEYREQEKIKRLYEQEVDDIDGLKLSQQEIDDDYEQLELSGFDNAECNN